MLKDYRLLPKAAPTSLVILLHGVGANGEDLLGLAETWQKDFPATAFISPDAPEAYDMAPFGRQWFSLQDWSQEKIAGGIKKTAPILTAYIDGLLKEFSLPASKTVLLGFSQGTMMSLYAGLRYPQKLAGILGYSGALFGGETLKDEMTAHPPICLIHGTEDNVVPVEASTMAASVLQAAGCATELHLCRNLGHSIDDSRLRLGHAFLQRTLA